MRLLDDRRGSAARNWMVSGVIWMAIGVTFGLLAATELAAPDVSGAARYLTFGRIRPLHVNTVWYGFLSMTLLGAGLHYVPQLCKTKLYSERVANLAMWIWNISQAAGITAVWLGYTQSHEYAEYPPFVTVMSLTSLSLMAWVTFKTIARREEPLIYVSIWYYGAALLWTITQWLFLGGTGAQWGIYDAVWTWFYGHNIFGLWITPLSIAAVYYTIPREVRQPLYSHTLSLLGFWLLVTDYAPTGVHHLLQAPVPAWQKGVAIVHSVLLLIPVYIFLSNIWLTMRGRMGRIEESMTLKYVFAGTLWYFVVSTQGSIQSLMAVQRMTHFTNWVVGHSHSGLLGFAGFIAVGVMYDVLPQVTGNPVYSIRLANFQYWLMLIGQSGFAIILTIAGLIQGAGWINGEEVYRVLPEMHLYMVLRGISGILVVAGAYIQLYNVWRTVRGGPLDREWDEPAMSLRQVPAIEAEVGG
ncbi:MAG TPA: cbb3-type cytochrome c oxidase subunit I [Armatimonadota bacterium]|jgi:cbb3-type cytochrome c oxidase subunit I